MNVHLHDRFVFIYNVFHSINLSTMYFKAEIKAIIECNRDGFFFSSFDQSLKSSA